jgi:hypothetical protein
VRLGPTSRPGSVERDPKNFLPASLLPKYVVRAAGE